jgi:cytosine deaminase
VTDAELMALAVAEASEGLEEGGEPVGSVVARGGFVLGGGRNWLRHNGDPTAHAEMEAHRDAACRLSYCGDIKGVEPGLCGATVYTTAMPCEMCSGAILCFQALRVVVAEATSYKPAGTKALLEHQGIDVHFSRYPQRRAAHEHGDDRLLLSSRSGCRVGPSVLASANQFRAL